MTTRPDKGIRLDSGFDLTIEINRMIQIVISNSEYEKNPVRKDVE